MNLASSHLRAIFLEVVAILFLYLLLLEGFFLRTAVPLSTCICEFVKLGYIIQLCPPFYFILSVPTADDMCR